jgi:hypothetical protein
MSEFRSKHIWQQDALKIYKYMMWVDGDSFATKPWKQDPIAFMVRNKLVLLMGKYSGGQDTSTRWPTGKSFQGFQQDRLHGTRLDKNGRLIASYGYEGPEKACNPHRCDVV